MVAESTAGRVGTGGDNSRGPGPMPTLTGTGDKYRGLADSEAVHNKQD